MLRRFYCQIVSQESYDDVQKTLAHLNSIFYNQSG